MRKMKSAMKKGGKKKSAMKGMRRRKAMKTSVRGKKWQVFAGTRQKSGGGLKKGDLIKNKNGKVVSKKLSVKGKALFKKYGQSWMKAVAQARKALAIKGFQAVGGKSAKGQAVKTVDFERI